MDRKSFKPFQSVITGLLLVASPFVPQLYAAELAKDYWPLESNNTWTDHVNTNSYDSHYETERVLPNTVNIKGVATKALLDEYDGSISYYTNDSQGIRLHAIYYPQMDGDSTLEATVYFSPPVKQVSASVYVGYSENAEGTVYYDMVNYPDFSISYQYSSSITGSEILNLDNGVVYSYILNQSLHIYGTVNGQSLSSDSSSQGWFAKGLGGVKSIENYNGTIEYSNISWTNLDDDSDLVADKYDNCPLTKNNDQANFDNDLYGDACDPDDDNDGEPDLSDAFPFDATETKDNDSDGIGDNADPDDDNDGMTDEYELANDLDPLTDDANLDKDGDGYTNLEEFDAGTAANNADDTPRRSKAWLTVIQFILSQ